MSKKLVAVSVILLLFGSALVFTLLSEEEAAAPNVASDLPLSTQKTPSEKSKDKAAPGQYVDYSEDIISSTSGTKVLFFHAPWCPQCRAIEAGINKDSLPDNTTFIKVDYDTNQALRQKYGVTLQTSFVRVDDEGNLEKKYVAYQEPTFESVKENIL